MNGGKLILLIFKFNKHVWDIVTVLIQKHLELNEHEASIHQEPEAQEYKKCKLHVVDDHDHVYKVWYKKRPLDGENQNVSAFCRGSGSQHFNII